MIADGQSYKIAPKILVTKPKLEIDSVTMLLQEVAKQLVDPSNENLVEKLTYSEDYENNYMNRSCEIKPCSLKPLFHPQVGVLKNYYK